MHPTSWRADTPAESPLYPPLPISGLHGTPWLWDEAVNWAGRRSDPRPRLPPAHSSLGPSCCMNAAFVFVLPGMLFDGGSPTLVLPPP